jgi:PAS domain S-box-containing protein
MDLVKACSASTQLLETVLASVQHAIVVADLEGNILYANPSVQGVFGFSPDELASKRLSVLFTPEDLTYLYPNLLYMARKDRSFNGELMLQGKDETRLFAFVVFKPFYDRDQDRTIIVICIQDIDRRKRLEKAFKETPYDDLVKVADGIAHELRNPLVAIGGYVRRLYKSAGDNHDHEKYYQYILKNLRRIEDIVKKVEFFAQLPKPSWKRESMSEVIEEAIKPYVQQVEGDAVDFRITTEDVTFPMDKELVVIALSTLVENALVALSDGGEIRIRNEARDNQCRVDVSDTGSGIAPENLAYIFNPFFSTKSDGAGLDLAVLKRIMESHGGSVNVKSKQGEGTTFSLVFPLERRRPIRVARLND